MDYAAAGLLDDLDRHAARARAQLLDRLVAEGYTLEELKAAVADDRLALLPVEQVLGGRYTASEVEELTGAPAAMLLWMRRLLGLPRAEPTDRVWGEADVPAARSIKQFVDAGLDEEALVEITRVLGESMARLAATTAAAFADSFLEPGDTEDEVAVRFATLAEQLLPALSPVLLAAFSAHLRERIGSGMLSRAELAAGRLPGSQELTICFADLVGFTRLGGEVELQELGSVAGRLAEMSAAVASAEVRLVKTIGDAAMFVGSDPGAVVSAALDLLEAVEAAELPSLRAGIALGPALQRGGDFFGHSVNLASRVTGIARPDSVLCTAEVHDAVPDGFDWSFAGRHRLKGVAEPVACWRARRLDPGEEPGGDAAAARVDARQRGREPRKSREDRPRR